MKKIVLLTSLTATLSVMPVFAGSGCNHIATSVKTLLDSDRSKILEIVANQILAAPDCACEVVKAAIQESKADVETVASIVDAAIMVSPDNMRLIAQCAVGVAPDSVLVVQKILTKYDPNGQSGQTTALGNPLNFPGRGPVRPQFPLIPPVIINSPNVSQVNPTFALTVNTTSSQSSSVGTTSSNN